MSYDHYLLPAEHADDPGSAARHLDSVMDDDATPEAQALADAITAHDTNPDVALLSLTPVPASGDCVLVYGPWRTVQETRDVIFAETRPRGYAVYDPQDHIVFDPRGAHGARLSTSHRGDFPYATTQAVEALIGKLRIDDHLIASTSDEHYIQTQRQGETTYAVEYREGDSSRHFATEMSTADDVAAAFRAWLENGPSELPSGGWARLTF